MTYNVSSGTLNPTIPIPISCYVSDAYENARFLCEQYYATAPSCDIECHNRKFVLLCSQFVVFIVSFVGSFDIAVALHVMNDTSVIPFNDAIYTY